MPGGGGGKCGLPFVATDTLCAGIELCLTVGSIASAEISMWL